MNTSQNPPIVMFRCEGGDSYNNINFARTEAEHFANDSGKSVKLFQIVNGIESHFTTVEPVAKLTS